MYNNITEEKIKNIPKIGDIDINRLPQELTRIYAQIVSLRRQVMDGSISFNDETLVSGLALLQRLSNNLETILLTDPKHEQKEAIAFVAGTANNLIHKMGMLSSGHNKMLEIDSISSHIAAIILFLIGNSQADAAEEAFYIKGIKSKDNLTQQRLISCLLHLAIGDLSQIENNIFLEVDIIDETDIQQIALNYLWKEIGLGINEICQRLKNKTNRSQRNYFNKVIELSLSESNWLTHKSVFSGPYRMAKLLKILEEDIFDRAVIDIPPPSGVDPVSWLDFLKILANNRPYLWENHKDAIKTNFLNPGLSAVLTLPTGAGKSTLSELKIASCIYSGRKVIYLVPTHALENQVNKNLRKLFSEFKDINIVIDGEYSDFEEIDSFPILVMTPERCLTFMNIYTDFFEKVGLIVFDEFHLIHGTNIKKDRRAIDAMYCLLSLFSIANHADYLLISAMVENGSEIANWVAHITGRECKLFNSTWKPTRQLHGCLVFEQSDLENLTDLVRTSQRATKTKNPPSSLKSKINLTPYCFFSLKNIWETENDNDYLRAQILDKKVVLGINKWWGLTSNRNTMAADLAVHFAKLGLKTLVFVDDPRISISTSRKIDSDLKDLTNNFNEYVDINEPSIDNIRLELGDLKHSYFSNCENVGVHHGLLLPIERDLIENYFKQSNGATVLVATATLAQGINLPAEIVIIAGDDRFDEDGENRQRVSPYELLNAAGRAGRAGLSSQGAVILIPGEIVSIKDTTISKKWWQLKNDVFSKGDQCLTVEDPLEYFLDSIQEGLEQMNIEQLNVLQRFKPENLFNNDTANLLDKSFYAYKAKDKNKEEFNFQVRRLLDRRNELDNLSENNTWPREISAKTGVEATVIFELGNFIEEQGIDSLLSKSIMELVDWFFTWLKSNTNLIGKIFTKPSTIDQFKKALGLKTEATISDILEKIDSLADIVKSYIQGTPLNELNDQIQDVNRSTNTEYVIKARNFVNRLLPELSFGFGLLSMIIVEKAKQNGINKDKISWNIKILASCIREGFDSADKLFYKKNNRLSMRVETHKKYNLQ